MEFNESPAVKIYLLGQFEIRRGKKVLRANQWNRQKAAALFKRLAWERKLLKEVIVDHLWPDATPTSGANNLYRALHEVRRTLDTNLGEGAADQIFSFSDGILALAEGIWVDAHEYEKAGKNADTQYLISNFPGDFLPDDPYEDWTQTPREYLYQLYKEALLSHVGEDPRAVIQSLVPLVARDPLDEAARRGLMRAYALTGRRHEALRQYQLCQDALEGKLGIAPDPQTTELYDQILQGKMPARSQQPSVARPLRPPSIPIDVEVEKDLPMIGRQKEMASLLQHLHAASNGQGQVLLIAGDTGVGKTRLAYEILKTAVASGMNTLLGTSYEEEGQIPYQPFIEAFNRYLSDHGLPADQHPILNFKQLGANDPQQEQWTLFNAVASFLREMTLQAPLVFLVDDLHAADETSLSLFHFLARQTRTIPVILLATYREDIPSIKSKPFGLLLNSLYRERLGVQVRINRLDVEAVNGIIHSILDGAADPRLAQAIFEVTEGNPFFVQEVTQSLLAEQLIKRENDTWSLLPGAKLPIPPRLTDLLLERVANLGEKAETTLAASAVLGREFRFDFLQGLSGLSTGETLDALDAALTTHLIEETENGYRFWHSLIRQTLYDSLSRARRAHLHTRAAEIIETFALERSSLDSQVENLAYHYLHSTERRRAFDYLLKAGKRAASVYALEVAIRHYEAALSLSEEFHIDDPAQRWKIHEALGWWYDTLADIPRAVSNFEQALALPATETWKSGHRDRARLHRAAATVLITGGRLSEGENHLKAALSEVDEQEDASDYALVLYTLSQFYWHKNEYQQAFHAAQRSLAIAERLNDQVALANAFEMLALTCHSLGEWQSGLQFERQRASLAGHELDVSNAFDVHL